MNLKTKTYLKKAIASYLRAAGAAVAAMLLAGMDDPTTITLSALIAGLLGPAVRALDPNDDAYGIGANIEKAFKAASGEEEKPAVEPEDVVE